MDLQAVTTLLITIAAVVYIAQRLYKSVSKKSCASGCGCGVAATVKKLPDR